MKVFWLYLELLLYLHDMENAKRIEEGDTVLYRGDSYVVIYSSSMYVNLKGLGTNETIQGVHISKIN